VSVFYAIWGASLNVLIFGAIIYGALKRSYSGWKLIAITFGVPACFNLSILAFKSELTFEQRLAGFAATLIVVALGSYLLRRSQTEKNETAHG
jgi:hypothetical protein